MFSRMLLLGGFVLLLSLAGGSAQEDRFGEAIDDEVIDELFRNVGQAYVKTFEITNDTVTFSVVLEDTVGEYEYWIVDFEPYDMSTATLAVDYDTGNIIPANTGSCSNVIDQAEFSHAVFGPGYYFSDDGNFQERNLSRAEILSSDQTNIKRLYTYYQRGSEFNDTDIRGELHRRRNYVMTFNGDFEFFFNCTKSDTVTIWDYSDTEDTVEFRTTIYFTNVRPRDQSDGTKGISWVSSSTELIYRLSRIAIVNFVLSSTALVKPVLDYVIIEPYFVDNLPVPGKAHIEIHFRTTIESPNNELLAYINGTLGYQSNDNVTKFDEVLDASYGPIPVQCNPVTADQCEQRWFFLLLLDVSDHVPQTGLPIDATGVFSFQFQQNNCQEKLSDPPSNCSETELDPYIISMEITIQTVVEVLDAELDRPRIELLSLQGEDGVDLRGGASAGRRGVNHLETVRMKVQFHPEFLRPDYDLDLMLFMVCKENRTINPAGCLDEQKRNRYVAYYHDDFVFSYDSDPDNDTNPLTVYNVTHVEEEWDPNGNSTHQQMLNSHAYDQDASTYDMEFTNTALSQDRLVYTITTVYKLLDRTRRRKRSSDDTDMVIHNYYHHRERRDIYEAAAEPQGHVVRLDSLGCPEQSYYEDLHCHCTEKEALYDTQTFTCIAPSDKPTETPTEKGTSSTLRGYRAMVFLVSAAIISLL